MASGAGGSHPKVAFSLCLVKDTNVAVLRIEARVAPERYWLRNYSMPALLFSPFIWKFVAILALASALFVSGCQYGQRDAETKLAVVEAAHEEAAKQARTYARETERKNSEAILQANDRAEHMVADNNARYTTELERVRKLAARPASGNRSVPSVPVATAYCLGANGPTKDELLGFWKTTAGLLREADTDRAILEACFSSWPR